MKYILEWDLKQDYGSKWDPTLHGEEIHLGEFANSGEAIRHVEKVHYHGDFDNGKYERVSFDAVEARHWDLHSTLFSVMHEDTLIAVANWGRVKK